MAEEVPPADREEQRQPYEKPPRPHLEPEVPEADALEQSIPEPYDEDERR